MGHDCGSTKRPFGDGSKFGSTQIVDVTKFQNSPKIVICACHPSCMRDSTCTFQKYGRTSQKYEFAHIVLSKSTISIPRTSVRSAPARVLSVLFESTDRTFRKYEFAHIVLSKSTIHAKRSIRIDKYYYFRPADSAKFASSSHVRL